MCVNNLPRVALDSGEAGIQTCDLLITSPASYRYATEPHGVSVEIMQQNAGGTDRVRDCDWCWACPAASRWCARVWTQCCGSACHRSRSMCQPTRAVWPGACSPRSSVSWASSHPMALSNNKHNTAFLFLFLDCCIGVRGLARGLAILSPFSLSLSLSLSLCFNGHFPGEPGLASVYWSKG